MSNMNKILIFGGNGFIGSTVITALLDLKERAFDITVVNRGRSWDWNTKDSVKPFVKCITFDREKDIDECKELVDLAEKEKFDYLIDFSGYEAHYLRDTTQLFAGKVGLYIYISTDSVYEVCEKKHNEPTVESDAKRPSDKTLRKKLAQQDEYGHEKLKCEEVLEKQNIPFVILRLADVIGAFDSTERWWQYQVWVQSAVKAKLPIHIKEELEDKPISMVYVKDIASVVKNIITGETEKSAVLNQSFNLACLETCTVQELVQLLAIQAEGQNVNVEFSADENVPQMYPSVERGPISIAKARKMLNFIPTPLEEAIKEIVLAYKSVHESDDWESEKESVLETLEEDLEDVYTEDSFKLLMSKMKRVLNLT